MALESWVMISGHMGFKVTRNVVSVVIAYCNTTPPECVAGGTWTECAICGYRKATLACERKRGVWVRTWIVHVGFVAPSFTFLTRRPFHGQIILRVWGYAMKKILADKVPGHHPSCSRPRQEIASAPLLRSVQRLQASTRELAQSSQTLYTLVDTKIRIVSGIVWHVRTYTSTDHTHTSARREIPYIVMY